MSISPTIPTGERRTADVAARPSIVRRSAGGLAEAFDVAGDLGH
jgi:hypothetical protein